MRIHVIAAAVALPVAAGLAAWLLTRPPAPSDLAQRALARHPADAAVVHQVVRTSGWTDRVKPFGYELELWASDRLRRVRWVDTGIARADDSLVDGELIANGGDARRLWYRSWDGSFVGERRLRSAADRREALALTPETPDLVGELRAALRSGLEPGAAHEEFEGGERWRITHERTTAGRVVRDHWLLDERSARIVGLRRERWSGDVLEDQLTYLLVRHEPVAPGEAEAALQFAAGR